MQVTGIVCEFNPFHLGHAYLLSRLRQRGADAIVCAMFFGLLSGGGYAAFMLAAKRLKKSDQFAFGPFLAFGLAVAALWGDQIAAWYLSAL